MKQLINKNKRMIKAMFLIAGCCIGAGMLGIPVVIGLVGFIPGIILFCIIWGFMLFTSLLLLESNGWFKKQVNIISIATKVLGKKIKAITWITYLLLFYSLLVAYLISIGGLLGNISAINFFAYSYYVNILIFVLFFSIFIYLGTKAVSSFNAFLMVGLIVSYLLILIFGFFNLNVQFIFHNNLKYLLVPISLLIASFGYHNIIPSITSYMHGDIKKVKTSIIGGSLMAFCVYLLWTIFALSNLPKELIFQGYLNGNDASVIMAKFLHNNFFMLFTQYFAFFAIATSFLTQGLTIMHFIGDGLKVPITKKNSVWLATLALLPPVIFAVFFPTFFYKALHFAGGICAVFLFCLLPSILIYLGRKRKLKTAYHVKCNNAILIFSIIFSVFILFIEIVTIIKQF